MRKKSILLLSGGFDSAANLAICYEKDEPILAITARYGQRAEDAEVLASRRLCDYYQVPHLVVDLSWLGQISNSSLTKKSKDVPQIEINQLEDSSVTKATAKAVWVPNRNGVLIHVAAAYAESMGAEQVLCGFNSEEAATFPDNSVEYLHRATAALALSTATQVKVASYTSEWNKRQIFLELNKLAKRFPLEWVWSCYEGASEPCGKCESCQRLVRATENLLQN